MTTQLLPLEIIARRILLLRDQKVLLDTDLAALYGVENKVLLQSVRRNLERFPEDFMFQLNGKEWTTLRSQIVTSNQQQAGRGGRRYAPYAFTEQGVAMLSSVLNSPQAVQVNIAIMRAFVKLRETLTSAHIPQHIRDTAPHIPWRTIIATRDRLIHGYLGIDNDTLWSVIQSDIPGLLQDLYRLKDSLRPDRAH